MFPANANKADVKKNNNATNETNGTKSSNVTKSNETEKI